MVEYSIDLDNVFMSLADATRRDMLKRLSKKELTISELARPYKMSFAAIAKHVEVLRAARLVSKRKEGREQTVSLEARTLKTARLRIEKYERMWNDRFEALDALLKD